LLGLIGVIRLLSAICELGGQLLLLNLGIGLGQDVRIKLMLGLAQQILGGR
jgi:hypothetical protein